MLTWIKRGRERCDKGQARLNGEKKVPDEPRKAAEPRVDQAESDSGKRTDRVEHGDAATQRGDGAADEGGRGAET